MRTDLSATFRSTVKFSSSEVVRMTVSFFSVAIVGNCFLCVRMGGRKIELECVLWVL